MFVILIGGLYVLVPLSGCSPGTGGDSWPDLATQRNDEIAVTCQDVSLFL